MLLVALGALLLGIGFGVTFAVSRTDRLIADMTPEEADSLARRIKARQAARRAAALTTQELDERARAAYLEQHPPGGASGS